MLVSWDWLKQYVNLNVPVEELAERLTMSGLNLEEFKQVGNDWCIDFEVTSNRPDCLGHLGIAREAAVLLEQPMRVPAASPKSSQTPVASATSVKIECPDVCSQYHARVIRGAKVGPSPAWMQQRLATVGIPSINNIVDITNYVMLECSQPLHAFDMDKLHGGRIVVRQARKGEKLQAIDHKLYELTPDMCVIADADHPVAIAGVMGGAETEITTFTKNILIEAALFAPLSIRNTARKLKLHSDSSHRFERALDPNGPDWASRRCCELILELAGGELLDGSVFAGAPPVAKADPVPIRFTQIERILGISVPANDAVRILQALGLTLLQREADTSALFQPPTGRRDLTREIDLIEEVARIYGYDKLRDDAVVPVCLSQKTHRDRVTDRVCEALTASGFYEALTVSLVSDREFSLFQPRGPLEPLAIEHPDFREFRVLRQSLIPSLLRSRRANERRGTFNARLYEIARVYLSSDKTIPDNEAEPVMLGLVSGMPFDEMKGVAEAVARRVNPSAKVTARRSNVSQFAQGRGAELFLNGTFWGWIGELDRAITNELDLRDAVTAAELNLAVLADAANLIAKFQPLPQYQSSSRDLNFVLDDAVTWDTLEATARAAAGSLLESLHFGGQYRGKQIPEGKKSYLLNLVYRAPDRTMTTEEVESAQQSVIAACQTKLGAALRA